jgi:hypothetical protein
MEIKINDTAIQDIHYEFEFHQAKGKECHFEGQGNGDVMLVVEEQQ